MSSQNIPVCYLCKSGEGDLKGPSSETEKYHQLCLDYADLFSCESCRKSFFRLGETHKGVTCTGCNRILRVTTSHVTGHRLLSFVQEEEDEVVI